MSSSGSNGSNVDYDEELALRIALELSKVDTGSSSRSRANPQLPHRWSMDAGAGPSRPPGRSRTSGARMRELDPPGPHATPAKPCSPHLPRMVSFLGWPLFHTDIVGS
ncbi:hypothetical protein D1007_09093 [Hordeum vulgare]|nr:hypothetical protein D1007_09093 [Hordeum vulgare]